MRASVQTIDKISKGSRKAPLAVFAFLTLALFITPAVFAADQSGTTNISVGVGDVITLTSTGSVGLSLIPTAGGVVSSGNDTVTVSTNNTTGYTLSLSNNDASTALTSGANTITAHNGTFAAPTALTNGRWGYAVAGGAFDASYTAETNNATSTSKWAGVPALATPQSIKTVSGAVSGDATSVWYAARIDNSQPAGTYVDTVTYTATTNN